MSNRTRVWLGATVIAAALVAAGWWAGLLPLAGGKAKTVEAEAGPFRMTAAFSPHPPEKGENTVLLTVRDEDGEPIEDAKVEATARMPAMGSMPEMRGGARVEKLGRGRYRLTLDLAMEGNWPLQVHLHAPDGRAAEVEFEYSTGIPVRVAGAAASSDEKQAAGDEVSHYTCSMHPSVKSKQPGTCPICSMDLVPVTKKEVETGTIRVPLEQRQKIGVTTGRAERREVSQTIRAVGRVTYDETRLADVTMKYRGWIGKTYANYSGFRVEKGEPLFTLYAPELLSAQEEFLESLRRQAPGRDGMLLESARRRLRLWDLTDAQVRRLAESGDVLEYMPILSPVTGTVTEKKAFDGAAVQPGMLLYRIADLSTVWIEAEVYEGDVPLVKEGQTAEVRLSYLPERTFRGDVAYIYPYLDAPTRTGRIRIVVGNADGSLKPDMYASVEIEAPLGRQLVVSEGAVVRAGKTNIVFLDLGEGRLRPKRIEIGRKVGDDYVVLSGLDEGDTVVTSGNFLIAAESKLKSGIDKW